MFKRHGKNDYQAHLPDAHRPLEFWRLFTAVASALFRVVRIEVFKEINFDLFVSCGFYGSRD